GQGEITPDSCRGNEGGNMGLSPPLLLSGSSEVGVESLSVLSPLLPAPCPFSSFSIDTLQSGLGSFGSKLPHLKAFLFVFTFSPNIFHHNLSDIAPMPHSSVISYQLSVISHQLSAIRTEHLSCIKAPSVLREQNP
ncbi:hypothetical protein, partial [Nostoc commune]|uniref:hypothetical protein n=1 Tax=Nostoc commune TaxID=1178 RepID=UPI001E4CC837